MRSKFLSKFARTINGGKRFYGYNQNNAQKNFFKLVKVRFEKKSFEERKKRKTKIWNLDLGKRKIKY